MQKSHPILIFSLVSLMCITACEQKPSSPANMVMVPAGSFTMGSNQLDQEGLTDEFGFAKPLFMDEHPPHEVELSAFLIDIYEATNEEYLKFMQATGNPAPNSWVNRNFPTGRDRYPVVGINWFEAAHYCSWNNKRLPSEAEWEKAARGTDARLYPWGNEFDQNKANTGLTGVGDETPVGSYPQGKSPYGAEDMAGNVYEWTDDWYQKYPESNYASANFGKKKVLRSGSWGGGGHYALQYFYNTTHRTIGDPKLRYPYAGVRCVQDLTT